MASLLQKIAFAAALSLPACTLGHRDATGLPSKASDEIDNTVDSYLYERRSAITINPKEAQVVPGYCQGVEEGIKKILEEHGCKPVLTLCDPSVGASLRAGVNNRIIATQHVQVESDLFFTRDCKGTHSQPPHP